MQVHEIAKGSIGRDPGVSGLAGALALLRWGDTAVASRDWQVLLPLPFQVLQLP